MPVSRRSSFLAQNLDPWAALDGEGSASSRRNRRHGAPFAA